MKHNLLKLNCLYAIEWKIKQYKRKENSLHAIISQLKKVKKINKIKIEKLNKILREKIMYNQNVQM